MTSIDELLRGAIDPHCHPYPAPFPRLFDVIDAAVHFSAVGFAGAVAKSHHHPTTTDIALAQRHGLAGLDCQMYGSVVLNGTVGGLNPHVVDLSVKLYGAKIVWLPTIGARNHHEVMASRPKFGSVEYAKPEVDLMPERIVDVTGADGQLLPALDDIIALVRDSGVALATGHLSADEAAAVVRRASEQGLTRTVVTHASFPGIPGMAIEQGVELSKLGAWVEHTLVIYDPEAPACCNEIQLLVDWIRAVGAERTILSSDGGFLGMPWGQRGRNQAHDRRQSARAPRPGVKAPGPAA
jgi:hypothetical protein